MKNKIDKKSILIILIATIISITSSYVLAATLVNSKDVYYEDNSGLAVNNVQAAIDGTCTKFSDQLITLQTTIINKIYPVGSIYISYNSTNPGSLFGGTWENYGSGRVLKGINSGTAGTTGGSDTITLTTSNLPAHTHTYDKVNANTGSHTLTIAEMPSHSHGFTSPGEYVLTFGGSSSTNGMNAASGIVAVECPSGVCPSTFSSAYIWFRGNEKSMGQINTAGGGGGHTHSISTTSTNTGSTGSSTPTAINVQNPYITVYMWRRTK